MKTLRYISIVVVAAIGGAYLGSYVQRETDSRMLREAASHLGLSSEEFNLQILGKQELSNPAQVEVAKQQAENRFSTRSPTCSDGKNAVLEIMKRPIVTDPKYETEHMKMKLGNIRTLASGVQTYCKAQVFVSSDKVKETALPTEVSYILSVTDEGKLYVEVNDGTTGQSIGTSVE